jgi:hypothetical protein
MVRFTTRQNETGTQRRSKLQHRLQLWCGAATAGLMLAAGSTRAALITPISASNVPVFNTASVFNYSQPGSVYRLEPGTSFIPEGFDVRDLFGGSFGTYGWEQNDVIFNNGQPAGTVNAVAVTLGAPTSLTSFNLFLEDDGTNGNRSASEFELFAGGQLVDDVQVLDTYGDESYTSVYGSNYIEISDTLSGLPHTSNYELEFIQNQQEGGTSGVRALEFEASNNPSSVPEPTAISVLACVSAALCARRKRTSFGCQ